MSRLNSRGGYTGTGGTRPLCTFGGGRAPRATRAPRRELLRSTCAMCAPRNRWLVCGGPSAPLDPDLMQAEFESTGLLDLFPGHLAAPGDPFRIASRPFRASRRIRLVQLVSPRRNFPTLPKIVPGFSPCFPAIFSLMEPDHA